MAHKRMPHAERPATVAWQPALRWRSPEGGPFGEAGSPTARTSLPHASYERLGEAPRHAS